MKKKKIASKRKPIAKKQRALDIASRLSVDMWTKLEQSATKGRRSIPDEVIYRLHQAFNFQESFGSIDNYRREHELLVKISREAALVAWNIRPVAGRPGWFFQGDNPPMDVEFRSVLVRQIEAVVERKIQELKDADVI